MAAETPVEPERAKPRPERSFFGVKPPLHSHQRAKVPAIQPSDSPRPRGCQNPPPLTVTYPEGYCILEGSLPCPHYAPRL